MKNRDFIDLGRIMDEIFEAAEDFSTVFTEGIGYKTPTWKWKGDLYPAYSYPPSNIYMLEDKTIVFEFALAGFSEEKIDLEFKGDNMQLTAHVGDSFRDRDDVKYLKRRLKLKDVVAQKFFVPEDKFDREKAHAVFKNGILRVTIPARDDAKSQPGMKVNIHTENAEEEEQ
ncbi:MAG: Hsp20/alpha crystallin family protein [Spirochaetaceae bacterium]|nr:MAG: Hsp20/alpha crystallin family protein [Spirochaetaceae bacterium]